MEMTAMKKMAVLSVVLGTFLMIWGAFFPDDVTRQQALADEVKPAYVSGGIGEDDPILERKKDYNLHLIFATKGSGEYLADVTVRIQRVSGPKVLETLSTGPFFYVNLPPGNYLVTAEFSGKSLAKPVTLNKVSSKYIYFHWE
jgi:hypothetical protein